jgi:hypothetical protein
VGRLRIVWSPTRDDPFATGPRVVSSRGHARSRPLRRSAGSRGS